METQLHTILIGMAAAGQTITKNTTVSIALVIVLLSVSVWVTKAVTSTDLRLSNVEESLEEMKMQQAAVFDYIKDNEK